MKLLMTFLAGALAGAAAALMLAPKSGTELRAQMSEEAARDRERIRQGYESASLKTQDSYDKMSQKLHRLSEDEIVTEEVDVEVDVEEVLTEE